jgi:hypothetical protein
MGVNETTAKRAPPGPVHEIGQMFHCLINLISEAKVGKVVMLAKIDLSDGFWHILEEEDQQ